MIKTLRYLKPISFRPSIQAYYCAMTKTSIKDEILSMPELKLLADLFNQRGHRVRLAGGVVRDILLNVKPNDYDLASDATPDKMIDILKDKPNIRLITTPSGEKHGTVAALINGSKMFEITTLRIDKITDGRHAEVEFIQDWKQDALRRDFTINSIFMELDGTVIDYFEGQKDLADGVIRFVGDPVSRMREDYLRIMRYFRFYARFGKKDHDPVTVEAMRDNAQGLEGISGERIWTEVKKTLTQKNCDKVIQLMFKDVNIAPYMGFHTDHIPMDLKCFNRIYENVWKMNTSFEPITLFTSLIRNEEELCSIITRLKLSNFEKESSLFIIVKRDESLNHSLRSLQKLLIVTPKSNQMMVKRYILEFIKYQGYVDMYDEMEKWTIPTFPLRGDKIGNKMKKRALIGKVMSSLKLIWADSDFEMTEEELLVQMDKLIEQYNKES